MGKIVIDPVTRIEGHLKIEAVVENGEVKDAWATRRNINGVLSKTTTGKFHTDDFPVLEFNWAHGIKHISILDSPLVEEWD